MYESLEDQAKKFADELNHTLSRTLPSPVEVAAVEDEDRFVVGLIGESGSIEGITLRVNGTQVGSLLLKYTLELDHEQHWLKVSSSTIAVRSIDRVPLLRFEYDDYSVKKPSAHWHVHSESARIAHMMTYGKIARKNSTKDPKDLSSLHLSVGGTRFRPCIEDVLETLITEFGIDRNDQTWRDALRQGRLTWRQRQLAAVIRDDPVSASQALEYLGWKVVGPENTGPARDALFRY